MWIVRVALQKPYTFIMLAVLIVLMGGYAILNTATDIFSKHQDSGCGGDLRYSGILPEEIANRIVLYSERIAQTTINDVEHTESQSVNGLAVVKYFFQPDVDQDLSMSQITAVSQFQLSASPPGTTPAVRAELQRLQRPHPAARAVERHPARVADLRSGQYASAHPAGDRGRRLHTLSLRRQAAPGAGSIWIPRRCGRMGCRATTSSRRSARRI